MDEVTALLSTLWMDLGKLLGRICVTLWFTWLLMGWSVACVATSSGHAWVWWSWIAPVLLTLLAAYAYERHWDTQNASREKR